MSTNELSFTTTKKIIHLPVPEGERMRRIKDPIKTRMLVEITIDCILIFLIIMVIVKLIDQSIASLPVRKLMLSQF